MDIFNLNMDNFGSEKGYYKHLFHYIQKIVNFTTLCVILIENFMQENS
jgi:hypothetical protein